VSDDLRRRSSSRARPVAEAPVDALLDRAGELAKRWAIALILTRPLEHIGEIPLDDLAREAPALLAHVVRALESDAELDRMTHAGAVSGQEHASPAGGLAALAGARDAGAAVAAVEALRSVLWEALMEELRWPTLDRSPARQVAELADRLAYVCAKALDATIAALVAHGPAASGRVVEVARAGSGGEAGDPDRPPAGRREPIIVDELEDLPRAARPTADAHLTAGRRPPRDAPPPEPTPEPTPEPSPESTRGRRVQVRPLWDAGTPSVARSAPLQPPHGPAMPEAAPGGGWEPQAARPQIEIRDERGEEGPAAWIGSIGRRLGQFERDGLPFAVLLVELIDAERPDRTELPGEFSRLADQVQDALGAELRAIADRPAGSVTVERPGRYWLLSPQTNGVAAGALAERLAGAAWLIVRRSRSPLEVAVGSAVCPEDGWDAATLAAHADVGLFASRAAARAAMHRPVVSVAPVDESV